MHIAVILVAMIAGNGQDGYTDLDFPRFIRGDANRDWKVDISDAVCIIEAIWGRNIDRQLLNCIDAGDANDDGAVNYFDSLEILRHLFMSGPPFPPLFPNPGLDPTGDDIYCYGGF